MVGKLKINLIPVTVETVPFPLFNEYNGYSHYLHVIRDVCGKDCGISEKMNNK